jgi:hypothetical protein
MAMRRVVAALLLLASCGHAYAGAWTLKKHHWQIISDFEIARAGHGYDGAGRGDAPIKFQKLYSKTFAEWGWNDRLTLVIAPEYSTAVSAWGGGAPVTAIDMGLEGGARYLLSDAFGVLSMQATLKYDGPYDLSHGPIQKFNSTGRGAARTEEIRLLYGTNFKLLGRDGFADAEAAQRFISAPRPNETAVDLTAGLWLGSKTMVMAQSFNTISGGDAAPPYTYFREHKFELSVVRCLTDRYSVQLGAFVAPAGQNTVAEQGLSLSVWSRR